MSFLAPAEAVVMRATAEAFAPPPPPDPWDWACEHLVFGPKSPRPGPLDREAFGWARRILEVLNPEHPAREVTVRASAQIGKTETIIAPSLACWIDRAPSNLLVVHPTASAASDWAKDKWAGFRSENPRLRAAFGARFDGSVDFQETLDKRAILYVEASGSASGLSGKSCPKVVMDDLSKFEPNPLGDPESLAAARAAAYDDGAKILRASTAMIVGACRITRAYDRGTREQFHVACPHCGHRHPLAWENFEPTIDPADPASAHFVCPRCQGRIEHRHKAALVAGGAWVAENPQGDHPSFHIWRAYSMFRDWASIAREWLAAKGDASLEQTFFNDVLGLPYAQASDSPGWERLRDRTENAAPEDQTPRTRIPAGRPILTAGADCQGDRIEVTIRASGRDRRAHTVDHLVIPHHVGTDEGRAALDELLQRRWRNVAGQNLALDRLAIDGSTYTEDVWSWVKRHPQSRVSLVKGASSSNGPIYQLQKFDRRKDGRVRRAQKRAYLVNVSALKAVLYADLKKEDPAARGFRSFATGLGDAYFRQLCAERRIIRRNRFGVPESRWEVIEADGRNEALDCDLYADVAARLAGWATMTDAEWDALEAERETPPPAATADLFDRPLAPAVAAPRTEPAAPPVSVAQKPAATGPRDDLAARFERLARG